MRDYLRTHEGEVRLFVVLAALTLYLGFASPIFFSAGNFASLLNNNAVNVIWAVGLLVVLIAGGIDISFAVAASVVQYLTALALLALGGGNWLFGLLFAGAFGIALGCINAALIAGFRIISIVVTIATFNAFFGLLDVHDIRQIDLRFARLVDRSHRGRFARRGRSAHPAGGRHGCSDGGDLVPDLAHDDGPTDLRIRRQSRKARGAPASRR